ncbi:MAG: hypothetical protein RMN52_10460 [Anaerolineae bacterium]|nr:hypothetical protein [Candidatus Roseilinea sp.]MDW8450417.1 hypothetical protein [Anaerolineae bacterium]
MLPLITDFIKDTLTESLKKPLQPSSLFAAAIFVLLSMVAWLPGLINEGNVIARYFLSLDAVWQLIFASVLTLVLAYGLNSLNNSIFRLMSGDVWKDSIPGSILTRCQVRAYNGLSKRIGELRKESDKKESDKKISELEFRRRNYFPYNHPELIGPTQFGNILNATSANIWRQYRTDLSALWPHLETLIADEPALSGRINNEKAVIDFWLNLSTVLLLFACINVPVAFHLRERHLLESLFWTGAALLCAYLAYRAALPKAIAWGDAIQMAFDLKREKLRTALGLRKFVSEKDEKEVWQAVSQWLYWNDRDQIDRRDIFEDKPYESPQTSLEPSVEHSSNVEVKVLRQIQEEKPYQSVERYERFRRLIYTVIVGTSKASERNSGSTGAYVIISDPKQPRIVYPPERVNTATFAALPDYKRLTAVEGQGNDKILWRIPYIANNGVFLFEYAIRDDFLLFESEDESKGKLSFHVEAFESKTFRRYRLEIRNVSTEELSEVKVKVKDNLRKPPTELIGILRLPDGAKHKVTPERRDVSTYWWRIRFPSGSPLKPDESIIILCKEGVP